MADVLPPGFVAEAEKQELRIDRLISCPEHARGQPIWSTDIRDPEFHKNLRTFGRLIAEAIGLCERLIRQPASAPQATSDRFEDLRRRIVLPEDKPLTLPVLLDHRFALELLLVDLGDKTYLRTRAAALYKEQPGTVVTWAEMYPKTPPPLFVNGGTPADSSQSTDGGPDGESTPIESTRAMLRQLLSAKEGQDLPIRARRELKVRLLNFRVVPFLTLCAIIFGLVISCFGNVSTGLMALSVTAAVTGAVLGQLRKLRDEVTRGAQVREFAPLFLAQIVVGLVTGLFVCVAADQLVMLKVSDPKQLATLSFAAGFSEAAFLGLVSKITGDSASKTPTPTPPAGH